MASVHATTISIEDRAVLLCGPSGSGKSDLALRLIDSGAVLIADDRTDLSRSGDAVMASPPQALAGLLEIRGVGIVRLPYRSGIPVALIVDLTSETPPRLPENDACRIIEGIDLPCLSLNPFEASAPAKVRAALTYGLGDRSE